MQLPMVMHVPDALFASDNEYDIPVLDMELQAEFCVLPWTRWGEIARSKYMPGTYHFYTGDYKFNALWMKPDKVVNAGCACVVEPNFSTNDQMPMAVGMWAIYRKRWMARYWQHYGIRIFVDLNVSGKFTRVNLLGVPRGWMAYATRGLDRQVDEILFDYEIAREHANRSPLFIVYGGGSKCKRLCMENCFVWIPENMHQKDGRERDYG